MAEQWNPFSQVAGNFAQGQQAAQGYAELALNVKKMQQAQEAQKATLAQAKEEHDFQKGSWASEQIQKLSGMSNGPWQNTAIKQFSETAQRLGIFDESRAEEFAAMMKDPEGVAKMKALLGVFPMLDDETQVQAMKAFPRALSGPDLKDAIDKGFSHLSDLAKMRQEKDLAARNEAQKAATPDFKDVQSLSKEANEQTAEFRKFRLAANSIDGLVKDDAGKINMKAMTGAKQYSALKAMNTFFDSPAYKLSDQQFQESLAPYIQQAKAWQTKFDMAEDPNSIIMPHVVMRDLYNASRRMLGEFSKMERQAVAKTVSKASRYKVPLEDVLEPDQIELAKLDPKKMPMSQDVDYDGQPLTKAKAVGMSSEKKAALRAMVDRLKKQGLSREQILMKNPKLTDQILKEIGAY